MGVPRVHAELRLGLGVRCGRKRVARLMRAAGLVRVRHQRKYRHRPARATHEDLIQRDFTATAPDRVWFTDVTQHGAADGWVYCCAVVGPYTTVSDPQDSASTGPVPRPSSVRRSGIVAD